MAANSKQGSILVRKENYGLGISLLFVSLFVCFEPPEQFFSYLAAVIIAGDRAAKSLTVFSSDGSFTHHTYCGPVAVA
jgi:hypothetical protein